MKEGQWFSEKTQEKADGMGACRFSGAVHVEVNAASKVELDFWTLSAIV